MSSPKKLNELLNEEEANFPSLKPRENSVYTDEPGSFGVQFLNSMKIRKVQKQKEITGSVEIVVTIPSYMRNGHGTGHGGVIAALHDIS